MNSKIVTAFVVASLMAIAFPMTSVFDESEGSLGTATGQYTVFYYNTSTNEGETIGWKNTTTQTYDAAQAVMMSTFWKNGDSMIAKNTGGTYPTPNHNYGDITTFRGITENNDDVWNVLVYQNGSWSVGSPYLGWYTCFSDQPSAWQTANIALYYGSSVTDDTINGLQNYITANNITLQGSTGVNNSNFQFTFYLKIAQEGFEPTVVSAGNVSINSAALLSGVTVTAYGSNTYLALKWAFGYGSETSVGNVTGEEGIPGLYNSTYDYWTYNGWLYSLFGLSTVQTEGSDTPNDWTDDKYAYWVIYDTYSGGTDDHKADYVLGQYAPLECAPIKDNTIALIFEETTV